jgi:hypothetical protein
MLQLERRVSVVVRRELENRNGIFRSEMPPPLLDFDLECGGEHGERRAAQAPAAWLSRLELSYARFDYLHAIAERIYRPSIGDVARERQRCTQDPSSVAELGDRNSRGDEMIPPSRDRSAGALLSFIAAPEELLDRVDGRAHA